jgi:hypothetical protein
VGGIGEPPIDPLEARLLAMVKERAEMEAKA